MEKLNLGVDKIIIILKYSLLNYNKCAVFGENFFFNAISH